MTDSTPVPAPEPDFSSRQLTPQQHRVINLLASGTSITEAAAQTGVHRNTIHHWTRTLPAFALEMENATREQTVLMRDRAIGLVPTAFDEICTVLRNAEASPSLKLRAAAMVLKVAAQPNPPLHKQGAPSFDQTLTDRLNLTHEEFAQKCTIVNLDRPPFDQVETVRKAPEPGRNSTCPCGSGLKYKRCCANAASATSTAA